MGDRILLLDILFISFITPFLYRYDNSRASLTEIARLCRCLLLSCEPDLSLIDGVAEWMT